MLRQLKKIKDASPLLVVALVALILARSIDQTIFYRLAQVYSNYVWYLGAIILPVAFLIVSWPVVWWKMVFTDDITPAMREFPHRKYLIMGALDTCFNLLSTWPIYWVGGTVANVLSQLVLPFNMVGSLLFLKTRYRKVHYIGSTLAVYGVLVRLIPRFTDQPRDGHASGFAYLAWVLMLVCAQIPAAASNVYKEIALKNANLDVWYMNAWIGMYQLMFGLITIPAAALPLTPHHLSLSSLPTYLEAANKCFFGYNVMKTDQCSGDGLPVIVFMFFIIFNVTYNQLMLYVFKRGSSVLFVIASAVRLPLVDLLLLSTFIAGRAHERFTIFDGYALFALVMAIVVYYSEKEEREEVDDSRHVRTVSRTPKMASPNYNNQRFLRGFSNRSSSRTKKRGRSGSRGSRYHAQSSGGTPGGSGRRWSETSPVVTVPRDGGASAAAAAAYNSGGRGRRHSGGYPHDDLGAPVFPAPGPLVNVDIGGAPGDMLVNERRRLLADGDHDGAGAGDDMMYTTDDGYTAGTTTPDVERAYDHPRYGSSEHHVSR